MRPPASQPATPPARPAGAPIHPLAAGLLVFVDNLWMLADWNAVTWLLTVPLSFLSVALPTVLIQRFLHRDGWGKSLGKGLLLGVIAGVPTAVTGTPVGLALLTWAGILRAKGAIAPQALVNEPPPIPIEAEIISTAPPIPPPPHASNPAAAARPAPSPAPH